MTIKWLNGCCALIEWVVADDFDLVLIRLAT